MDNINVTALVKLVGINENTLRAWERRYGAVKPERDKQGRRIYNNKDLERIKTLWALVKEGYTIGLIAELPTVKLKKMLSETLSPEAPILTAATPIIQKYLDDIIAALEKFDLEKLNQTLQRARFEVSNKEIVINLIRPLMTKVGELTINNTFSITQEHLLSSLLRDYLGNIHQTLMPYDFSGRANAKCVLISAREGDVHEFGILLAAILSNLHRFRTYYLGPNMPVQDLVMACEQFKADYLLLGITPLPTDRELITPKAFLDSLDKALPRRITFCCGGAGTRGLSKMTTERKVLEINQLEGLDRFLAEESD